ncbi:MAG: integrase core domain-containing protein [Bryobacteraceae bacterium]
MGQWRRHSREFKQQAVKKMKTSDNIHELARELGIERKLLYTWKYQFEGRPEKNHASYSMSRPANPYDNATCESFMKTLKQEEIYCREYRDLEDLQLHMEEFLDGYYNRRRLHSALGYRTPVEFEEQCGAKACGAPDFQTLAEAPKISFFRQGKSINPIPAPGISGGAGL